MNGNKLKKLRTDKKLLQEELGKKVGVSASTIGMYEQNRREPDNTILKKIADYFEVSTDYLLDHNVKETEIENIINFKNLLIKNGFMTENEDLSEEQIDKIFNLLNANKDFLKK